MRSFGEYGSGPGQHVRPTHTIPIEEKDGVETLLVVDNGNGHVVKLRDGQKVLTYGEGDHEEHGLETPTAVAVDDKVLVVADTNKHRAAVYELHSGKYLRSIGSNETLDHPIGVAIHKNELWVVEYKGHRLSVLDFTTGELLRRVGSGDESGGDAYLQNPRDVAFSGDEVFVTDTNRNRIAVFSETGEYLRSLGEPSEFGGGKGSDGQPRLFDQPYGVTVLPGAGSDGADALLVSEYRKQNGRVQIVNLKDGKPLVEPLKYIPDSEAENGRKGIGGLNFIHADLVTRRAFVGCMQSHRVHELTLDPEKAQQMREEQARAAAAKTEL